MRWFAAAAALLPVATSPGAAERSITVASTTSTEQSGLFDHLLPRFTARTGIAVRVVAVGTGQALDIRLFFPDAQAPPPAVVPSAAMRLAGAE